MVMVVANVLQRGHQYVSLISGGYIGEWWERVSPSSFDSFPFLSPIHLILFLDFFSIYIVLLFLCSFCCTMILLFLCGFIVEVRSSLLYCGFYCCGVVVAF